MILRSIFLNLIVASVALLAIPAFAAAQTTELPGNIHYMSGFLNFTRGQAVSLNFTNVAREPKNVSLNFLDGNGNLLKTSPETVLPGETVSLNFAYTEMPRASSTRVGIRAVAVVVDPPEPDTDPTSPELGLVGVEVFDLQSSKTLIGLLLPAIRNANVFFPTDQ
jgi:hypothetical protein